MFYQVSMLVWFLMGAMTVASAQTYPNMREGRVPFRRAMLPIEVREMDEISRRLAELIAKAGNVTSVQRRTQFKLASLALALNPDDQVALDWVARVKSGTVPPSQPLPSAEFSPGKEFSQSLVWLGSPSSSDDGRAFALLAANVIRELAPNQTALAGFPPSRQAEKWWSEWLPPMDEFQDAKPAEEDPVPTLPAGSEASAEILLTEAKVRSPMWVPEFDAENKLVGQRFISTDVEMEVMPQEIEKEFSFSVRGEKLADLVKSLEESLVPLLSSKYGPLPYAHLEISLAGEDYSRSQNHRAISAPAAVLLDAALRGAPPDCTVIGEITEEGEFQMSPRFWDKLRALREGPGGRLILPTDCAGMLASVLAVEDPEFFFRYEVLLATDFKQLCERGSSKPDALTSEGMAKFSEIRKTQGTQLIGPYLANKFVRTRLEELASSVPYHYSARMLALQGSGRRPTVLPKAILASELRAAILPVSELLTQRVEDLSAAKIETAYLSSRSRVDWIARYVDIADRALHEETDSFVNSLREFSRVYSRELKGTSLTQSSALATNLKLSYGTLAKKLAVLSEDEEPTVLERMLQPVPPPE